MRRVLALDVGDKRIGVAVSDPLGITAQGLETYTRTGDTEKDAEHIAEYIRTVIPRVDVSFVLNNLEFLHKGGRCSGVAALGANLLKLKPCIEVTDGKMGVGKKYRGSFDKCVCEYITDKIGNRSDLARD